MATAPPAPSPASPSTPPPSPPAPASSSPPPAPASSSPPPAPASSPPPSNSTSPPPSASPPAAPATPSSPPPSSPSPPSSPGTPPSSPSPPPPSTTPSTPSTPSTKSPPPPPPTPSSSSPSPPSSGTVPVPLITGIAVAAAVVLVIVSVLFICCRKKRRRSRNQWDSYGQPPPPPPPSHPHKAGPGDPFGGYPQRWQSTVPPSSDNVIKISHPPQPAPVVASRPPQPPPPLPLVIGSNGDSRSMYSGSEGPLPPPSPGLTLGLSKCTFTYEELASATNGFSSDSLLGQGGFGYVHKGILPNGQEVAVKQLKSGSGQGEREFQAEVEIISRVHHRHLVSLVGYCISGAQRMLVYEFVPNNTLEFHLHGKGQPTMDWSTRLKIALGSAKGLAYLHEDCHPRIIHRDIKASNILLDFKFEAKVADFGLAKLSADNNTHVSTRVMGTFGYLAPEYASSGKLTEKSDVFSFGVMLLELITGRRPFDASHSFTDDSLVDWARPLLTRVLDERNFQALADPKLQNNYDNGEMARMVACAATAVRHSARRRPRMSQIVRALEGDVSLEDLNEGIRPGHSTVYGSYGSSDYDSGQYNEDMKKFRQMAFGQDYGASGQSIPTSEYGLNASTSSSEGQQTRELEMRRNRG